MVWLTAGLHCHPAQEHGSILTYLVIIWRGKHDLKGLALVLEQLVGGLQLR